MKYDAMYCGRIVPYTSQRTAVLMKIVLSVEYAELQWHTEEGGEFKTPPKFRSFDKVEPDCKLSRKCLVFLFQHLSLKIAEFRTPTPQDVQKEGSKILKLPMFVTVLQ